MKTSITVALAALAVLGAGSPAAAFSLSPSQTRFNLNGTMTVTTAEGSAVCKITVSGTTGQSGANDAKFRDLLIGSADSPEICSTVTANYPFNLNVAGSRKVRIAGFRLSGGLGACGPTNLQITVTAKGVWSFDAKLPGGCTVTSSLMQSKPAIGIVP